MKILFTGMTSAHTTPHTSDNKTFFGMLSSLISEYFPDSSVEIKSPGINWTKKDLDKYDLVFVGIVPPTSLSANKIYGALNIIDTLYDSPKLRLVLDYPQLWQFKASLNSIVRDPESLIGSFYSKRQDYFLVNNRQSLEKFARVCGKLLSGQWPTTIYPRLPWKKDSDVYKALGLVADRNFVGLNLDSFFATDNEPDLFKTTNPIWAIDNDKTSWSKAISEVLTHPTTKMRPSKKHNDIDVSVLMGSSTGSLISPQDRGGGTWWSYRYMQSLNVFTPVVSDWKETHRIGESWSFLAYQVEDMTLHDRIELAKRQKDSYINSISSKQEVLEEIKNLLVNIKIKEVK